ncbi:hypothetical protein [Streptomyces sp. A5-4]|uniref:hypothetical protein n=1 Tax=Streptomyces sp. A5-4 TaxID=3384771 RepID=UPI003DAA45C2
MTDEPARYPISPPPVSRIAKYLGGPRETETYIGVKGERFPEVVVVPGGRYELGKDERGRALYIFQATPH